MGLGLMLVTSYIIEKNYPVAAKRASFKEVGGSIKSGFASVDSSYYARWDYHGIFTPTEAATVAAGYALFISIFI